MPTGRSLAEVLEGSILGGHRMSNRARRNGKALSLLIVWSIALGGIFAAIVSLSPAARAGPCDQVGVISGDWTITTAQVCTGITFTVDGSININSGGSLRLVNGGLSFSKDAAHADYALNVNAGGALILDSSIVTTQTTAINPYLKLALTVSGAGSQLVLMNGAKLKFPGWFNATGASVHATDWTITGFTTQEMSTRGLDTELNDDSPIITWASTTATLFHSTIDRVYQDGRFSEGSRPGGSLFNVSLTASSTLYAYDTYLSVDYSNVVGLHNELHVDGTSSAYLYNVTIDRTQDPLYLSNWTSTVTGGAFFNPYPAVSAADNNQWSTYPFDLQVRTLPDLELRPSDYTSTMNVIQNQPFAVVAKIYNRGQTDASAVSIAAYLNGDLANQLARLNNLNVAQGAQVNQSLSINGLATIGPQRIMLVVDPSNSINEGGAAQEANNYANLTLDVTPPPNGYVAIGTPGSAQTVDPGTALSVTGYVRDSTNDNGISGIQLTIELRSPTAVIATNTTSSGTDGLFVGEIVVPDVQDGAYSVVVTPTAGSITPQTQSITITKTVPFLNRTVPILGLPYWLFFIILAAAAAAVIGVTPYWKIYRLRKMVECGECGAFIPEDSTSCPKWGVGVEKGMAE